MMKIFIFLSIMVLGVSSKTPGLSVSVSRGHGLAVKDIVVKRGKGEWESITGTCRACCQKSCSEISIINEQQSKIDVEVEAIVNMTKIREDAVRDFESDLQAEIDKVKKLLKEVQQMTGDAIATTEEPLQHITPDGGDDDNQSGNNENTIPPSTTTPAPTTTTTTTKPPWTHAIGNREIQIPLLHPKDYIRLTGGKNHFEGRLEVLFNGTWGTVCEDKWKLDLADFGGANANFRKNNLDVACRQLGFGKGLIWQSIHNPNHYAGAKRGRLTPDEKKKLFTFDAIGDHLPAIVDELSCYFGTEPDLYECERMSEHRFYHWGVEMIRKKNEEVIDENGTKANDCHPKDDVYIRCEPPSRAKVL